jgi:L-amino acid N-acyltransferase YncA
MEAVYYDSIEAETEMRIRDAEDKDISGILEIYNDAVLNTTAIWNDITVDAANRAIWFGDRKQAGFPVLVATDDEDRVIGYASFGDWRAFDGYRHTVEHSVYVHKDRHGGGIGKSLMVELIYRAKSIGKHVMVAGIEAKNVNSIKLHERLGFEQAGHLKEVGTKFGEWLDLIFMQLKLDHRGVQGQPA